MAVRRIEKNLGSCLGKRQSRATNWQRFLRPFSSKRQADYSFPHSAVICLSKSSPPALATEGTQELPTQGHKPFMTLCRVQR